MEKSNIITRIIKKFLSGRFSVETEEKVQRWIMKEENAEEKEKASLEYWNELDTEADSKTYSALERVNLRTGYNKEHLENIVLYHNYLFLNTSLQHQSIFQKDTVFLNHLYLKAFSV